MSTWAQNIDSANYAYNYSLKELSELKILTGSLKAEKIETAPSNITIITEQMIEERGYQTLVDICQDIPGFDFMMFNDGSGNYPTYNMNRGLGEVGNPEILIMIDGIIQNNISFNWSLLWTYENMLIDVERIEIIQGPGSVMYGAQAFTGVIHIITKKNFTGANVQSFYGANNTYGGDVHIGAKLNDDINLSIAFHKYHTDGDGGLNRHDPGGYFSGNKYPAKILADYNSNGEFIQDTPNRLSEQPIPSGFYNENNSYAIRTKLAYKNTEFGFFLSELVNGYGSYIVPYEYELTDEDCKNHYKSYSLFASNKTNLNEKISLKSDAVFRATHIIPSGGFKYLYRFPELAKKYAAYAYQGYIEEKLNYEFNEKTDFSFGIKASISQKSEWIISLGSNPDSRTSTNSSWDIASSGNGINKFKEYPTFWVKEAAAYALWDNKWFKYFSSSVGLRYDYSSEFGSIINPRLAIDYYRGSIFGAKFMYGTAFRQPGIFELTSEFRGNPNLLPQEIQTAELELNSLFHDDKIALKANIFYSKIDQLIGKVEDSSMPSGERLENINEMTVSGGALYLSTQLHENARLYSNYSYLIGLSDSTGSYEIERTAKHKINAGINMSFLDHKLIADFRLNFVGKRKAQSTNTWLQMYEKGYAPSYTKANFVLSYKFAQYFTTQLIVNNVFNKQFYGVGRETGSGFIDDYDFQNNINPDGFIPSYHPQPGRTYMVKLIFKM